MMQAGMHLEPAWLARAADGHWLDMPEKAIQRVCHDTRTLQPGDLYVAVRGARLDGHALLDEAFRKGAVAALVDQLYAAQRPAAVPAAPLLVVQDTLTALGRIASVHRHRLQALIVGVTGSMGKTTVKDMAAALLQQKSTATCTQGNWNNHIGLPLSMLGMGETTRFGVFELGMNHPGEILPLSEMLSPDWGIVTAIGPVHLEFFDSVEAIANEKADLLRALPRGGLAFLHADDAYFPILAAAAPCAVRTISLLPDSTADLCVESQNGVLSVYEQETQSYEQMPVPVAGRHNLINAGLAILVARTAGCDWEQIRQGFSQYRPPPMRWEVEACGPYTVVNDAYNANPVSMVAALDTFAQMRAKGRKWLLLGDMLELGDIAGQAHRDLGEQVAAGAWTGMVAVGLHAQKICDAARAKGMADDVTAAFHTVQEAGAWLLQKLQAGDTVLLKGSRGVHLENVLPLLKKG